MTRGWFFLIALCGPAAALAQTPVPAEVLDKYKAPLPPVLDRPVVVEWKAAPAAGAPQPAPTVPAPSPIPPAVQNLPPVQLVQPAQYNPAQTPPRAVATPVPAATPMPAHTSAMPMPGQPVMPVAPPMPGYVGPPSAPISGSLPAAPAAPVGFGDGTLTDNLVGQLTGDCSVQGCFSCGCPQAGHCWVRAEYLLWRTSGGRLPVLTTTSPAGTPIAQAGIPGLLTTGVLFGGDKYLDDWRSGFRIGVGTWLNPSRTLGLEANFFYLGSINDGLAGVGGPILASSPFIDATTGAASRVLISYPGVTTGATSVEYESRRLFGFDLLARHQLGGGAGWRVDGLAGYRYLNYAERLQIRKTIVPDPNGPVAAVPGTVIQCDDDWDTETHFCGLALGVDAEWCCGDWSFSARPQVAIGQSLSRVSRGGQTILTVPGDPTAVYAGGTFNLASNLGDTTARGWTIVPQLDLRVSRAIGENARFVAGYSFLYLPLVARAGDQIDLRVNPALVPPAQATSGPFLPAAFVNRDSLFAHGVSAGLEFRY